MNAGPGLDYPPSHMHLHSHTPIPKYPPFHPLRMMDTQRQIMIILVMTFVGAIHFIWKVYIFALFCANFAELFHYERCDVSGTKMETIKDEIAPLMRGQEWIGTKDEIV